MLKSINVGARGRGQYRPWANYRPCTGTITPSLEHFAILICAFFRDFLIFLFFLLVSLYRLKVHRLACFKSCSSSSVLSMGLDPSIPLVFPVGVSFNGAHLLILNSYVRCNIEAWEILHFLVSLRTRLNQTESAIFAVLFCAFHRGGFRRCLKFKIYNNHV